MLDSIYHMTNTLKSHFWRKNVIILSSCMDVITFPVSLKTTSGLWILLHGVISLPDATSYDKCLFCTHNFEFHDWVYWLTILWHLIRVCIV